jgi:membrane-associated phospholipid phosphatase
VSAEIPTPQTPTPTRRLQWTWIVAAIVLIVLGLVGLDPWIRQNVSLVLNTEDRPFDRDFYFVTKPFWMFCRYAFAHALGAAAIYTVLVVLQPQRWRVFTLAMVTVVVAAGLAHLAQGAIGRYRPNQADGHLAFAPPLSRVLDKTDVGFPSGEATTAFALATVLTMLFPAGRWAFYAAGTLAALTRLVNGAHYFSDVVGGALLGSVVAFYLFGRLRRMVPEPPPARSDPRSASRT